MHNTTTFCKIFLHTTQNIAYLFAKPVFMKSFVDAKLNKTGGNMDIENIVSLISSGISLIGIIIYFIMWLKNNKKTAKQNLEYVLGNLGDYINQANTNMPNATKTQKINYVLSLIKTDCEELHVKFNETKIKAKIEEAVE